MAISLDEILNMPDRDLASVEFARYFLALDTTEQERIAAEWPLGRTWKYPNAGQVGVQKGPLTCEDRAKALLVGQLLQPGCDQRDDLMGLAMVYHGLRLSGADADGILRSIAATMDCPGARLIQAFMNRAPRHKSMSAFGLRRVGDTHEIEWDRP